MVQMIKRYVYFYDKKGNFADMEYLRLLLSDDFSEKELIQVIAKNIVSKRLFNNDEYDVLIFGEGLEKLRLVSYEERIGKKTLVENNEYVLVDSSKQHAPNGVILASLGSDGVIETLETIEVQNFLKEDFEKFTNELVEKQKLVDDISVNEKYFVTFSNTMRNDPLRKRHENSLHLYNKGTFNKLDFVKMF